MVECKGELQMPPTCCASRQMAKFSKVRENTRDSVNLKVVLTPTTSARLQNDPSLRVMVYCAVDSGLSQYTKCDITFPHQVELKANLDDVKANLRGLKNKPGSTRPADITSFIRKKSGYVNHVVMTYALTQKVGQNQFTISVWLPQQTKGCFGSLY